MTLEAAVLAGGTSSRFGGHKGLARVGGERILDRVVQAVSVATGSAPVVVANAENAEEWRPDLQVRRDAMPNCGSLGGIYTALAAATDRVFITAWDMPFLTPELLEELIKQSDSYDVFVPQSGGPQDVEPLCGIYAQSCLPHIRKQLTNEDFQATGFHERVNVGMLPQETVEQFGDPETLFFNVNTQDDLKRAEELWRAQHA